MPRYRLGIDIGGTFTDATLLDEVTGAVRIVKVSTTPRDPAQAFMEVVRRLLKQAEVLPAEVRFVVHATTIATNAIIEGKVAATGFVTTEGFRDILEIARQVRPSLYDLRFEKPPPLVPRHRCFGVLERLGPRSEVLRPLDEETVRHVAAQLRQEKVESVAVCLLHAHVNPCHEQRVGAILREALPGVLISLSSEVAPEFREYLRASTTVINACIRPGVARYLHNIESRLRETGLTGELLVMQSSGGVITAAAMREKPVYMIESGPAAGVTAAAHLGNRLGFPDVISFDMGGTTAKAALIENGTPRLTKDYEVGASARAGSGSQRGGGYPIRTSVLDLVEIGAGGGSIAWVDSGGMLRVGPPSAGADPGPASYGKGGREPTVTDANLILGRINPNYFLGGEIVLDAQQAERAIHEKCARTLGMEVPAAAQAIVEIANAAMVNALRLVSVQRGYDPRDFVLVAFGGAGPAHVNRLAAEMGIATTLIPLGPGIFSAHGLLVSDLKHDYSAPIMRRADRVDRRELVEVFMRLEKEGRSALIHDGVGSQEMVFHHRADLRYAGQSFELTVPVLCNDPVADIVAETRKRFHREHERAYGYSAPAEPVEWVNVRLTALGKIAKPALRDWTKTGDCRAAQKASRPVYFAESNGFVPCPVYDRYLLPVGAVADGPAIVEELDSTTVIHPGYHGRVDRFGNLLLQP
ncbi:MAG TPA: hydantoinase/oxoprolinase family protein [Gemmataceae bacterium]|nr:hydantoinase/oxoprolinase family protein [Gemmataceae bacterium]